MIYRVSTLGDLVPAQFPETQNLAKYAGYGEGVSVPGTNSGMGFDLPANWDMKKILIGLGAVALIYFLIKRKSGYAGAVESARARHREELARLKKQYKRGYGRVVDAAGSAWSSF